MPQGVSVSNFFNFGMEGQFSLGEHFSVRKGDSFRSGGQFRWGDSFLSYTGICILFAGLIIVVR